MRLIIIRHGDPDYEHDTLTEKGWKEAELLADRISRLDVKEFYVSPLGRAKDTASLTLKKMNRTATECEWLREFKSKIWRPDVTDRQMIPWDWLPQDWMKDERFFHYEDWKQNEHMQAGDPEEQYDWVVSNLDQLLKEHGYERDGKYYRVNQANTDTIVFFCHFGLECAVLSHLINVSPMIMWHHFCAAPTSVTTVFTEERRKGIADFRIQSFGDLSHLYVGDEEPSDAAKFCEIYANKEQRHD